MANEKLHVEQLKETLCDKNLFSFSDFFFFYKKLYPEIKENTVRLNVYKLKEKKIIKNVARGMYSFEGEYSEKNLEYAVITMDIIGSSQKTNEDFNSKLFERVHQLNNEIYQFFKIESKFNISQGDEIQIICNFDNNLGKLLLLTLSQLSPYKARFAISIGTFIAEEIKENSWDMNGPIFWNARDKLNSFKKSRIYDGAFISEYLEIDEICNKFMKAILVLINSISEKQWEAISYQLKNHDLKEVQNILKISQSSFYDRIKGSNYIEIMGGLDSIIELMKVRRKIK